MDAIANIVAALGGKSRDDDKSHVGVNPFDVIAATAAAVNADERVKALQTAAMEAVIGVSKERIPPPQIFPMTREVFHLVDATAEPEKVHKETEERISRGARKTDGKI